MAQYNIGDKVVLKDDGQLYKVVALRIEDRIVLYDLEKGNQDRSIKLTVLGSQIEVQKVYAPQYPQTIVYKAK